MARRIKGKVSILGVDGNARWSDIWRENPFIASPDEERNGEARGSIRNGSNCRPYIKYPFTAETGVNFTSWRARDYPGTIYFSVDEYHIAKDYKKDLGNFVIIEPHIKKKGNPNKQWGWHNWKMLAFILQGLNLVQLGPAGTKTLPGVKLIETYSFRHACIILSAARVSILPEGGLHHAAAAIKKPAVVIFGGFVSPETTGYPEHKNIYSGDGNSPCGKWKRCTHCEDAMDSILPIQIADIAKTEYLKSGLDRGTHAT